MAWGNETGLLFQGVKWALNSCDEKAFIIDECACCAPFSNMFHQPHVHSECPKNKIIIVIDIWFVLLSIRYCSWQVFVYTHTPLQQELIALLLHILVLWNHLKSVHKNQ